jgi:hypothetical protein|tara:strand:- start:44 stop:424 length:381 start_codon:yes stop_codon:yes gene_type:complete
MTIKKVYIDKDDPRYYYADEILIKARGKHPQVLKYKLSQWKGTYRGWNLRSSHHYVNHEYHIYDHKENEGYFVLGHDQLCLWLNNTFDCRRYRVFTSYPQLKAYVDNFKGVLDSPAMKFIEEQYGD